MAQLRTTRLVRRRPRPRIRLVRPQIVQARPGPMPKVAPKVTISLSRPAPARPMRALPLVPRLPAAPAAKPAQMPVLRAPIPKTTITLSRSPVPAVQPLAPIIPLRPATPVVQHTELPFAKAIPQLAPPSVMQTPSALSMVSIAGFKVSPVVLGVGLVAVWWIFFR